VITALQKIAIVQSYIYHRKGVNIKIQVPSNFKQTRLLSKAFITAQTYFNR